MIRISSEDLARDVSEPNPQKVEFTRDAPLMERANQLSFSDVETDLDSTCLADSGDILIPVHNKSLGCCIHPTKNRL